MKTLSRPQILWMVQTAILTAIIVVMAFTPLGYLKVGTLSITLIPLPVVIGAVIVGPLCGTVLGLVFGITSFMQCFGLDAFGALLLGINPLYTAIVCIVPRVLMGLLAGLIFKALRKVSVLSRFWSFLIASFSGAALNTIFFLGALVLFFVNSSVGPTILSILGITLLVNATIEAGILMVAGTAITKAIGYTMRKRPADPS
jgi:uncharacterized membrane protein